MQISIELKLRYKFKSSDQNVIQEIKLLRANYSYILTTNHLACTTNGLKV
jgi:hypothetical protein